MNSRLMPMSKRPRAHRAWYWTDPVVALAKPEVSAVVSVAAGDSRPTGMIFSTPPMTIWTARVSPKARVMPRITAVMSEGSALLRTTCQTVCQRVQPRA